MAIPTYEDIMLPLLKFISDNKVHKIKNVVSLLEGIMGLTDDERKVMRRDNNSTAFYDRAKWAKTYLKKANLVEYPSRGTVKITQRGLDVIESNVSAINNKFLEQYEEFREFKYLSKEKDANETEEKTISIIKAEGTIKTPRESMDESFEMIKKALQDDI